MTLKKPALLIKTPVFLWQKTTREFRKWISSLEQLTIFKLNLVLAQPLFRSGSSVAAKPAKQAIRIRFNH